MVKTAIILAGGKGERLRPLTNDRPKVMVDLNGKPILHWQIEWMKKHGISNFILTVSYMHEVIEQYFGDGSKFNVSIKYSVEDSPLGRGGAIKKGMQLLENGDQDVVVANGDIVTRFNLSEMIKNHENKNGLVSLLLVPYLSRWGVVKVDNEDHVVGFEEKPKLPFWINGGIYVFSRQVAPLLPEVGDHELETFPKINKERFLGFKDEGFWRAVDVIKDRSEAEKFLQEGKTKFY